MARGRKGSRVNGWLVIDKPAGVTSTTVVGRVRWALDAQKAGHAGTLDPDATGVLAVALGEATKTVAHLTDALKTYRFLMRFGAATSTDDAAGEVIETCDHRPTPEAVEAALPAFRGDIMQVPPQVSAVKVEGERAYDLARAGVAMELAARPLHVARLVVLERPDADHLLLEMTCGKGGYVRAIARDLGRALGTCAHVVWLRRTTSGPFDAAVALPMSEVERLARDPALLDHLLPPEAALSDMPMLEATPEGAERLSHGNAGEVTGSLPPGTPCWVRHQGRALAIGHYMGGRVQPDRVLSAE